MKNLTIANRYADALYAEAKDSGMFDTVVADLNRLDELLRDSKDFSVLVNTSALTAEEKLTVIEALGKNGGISRLVYAFLVVLTRKRRLSILPGVVQAIRRRVLVDRGEVEAQVSYAAPVNDTIRNGLKARLAQITGKAVILKETVDPSLLGGLRVIIGSTLYDASVRGKLDAIRTQLSK